jgi:hypothetical protein
MNRLVPGVICLALACRGAPPQRASALPPTVQAMKEFPALPSMARSLDSLRQLDPITDARRAVGAGDSQLWAVEDFVLLLPGVPDSLFMLLKQRLGYRVMPWTGDATFIERRETDSGWVVDSTHGKWQVAARSYARRYNRELLALIRQ